MLSANPSEFRSWENRDHTEVTCANCGKVWDNDANVERWPCSVAGCETWSCDTCKAVSPTSDGVTCAEHMKMTETTRPKKYTPPPAFADMPAVDRVAHLFDCFYHSRVVQIAEEEGITDEEFSAGAKLAVWRKDFRSGQRAYYGDPSYGSWPEKAGVERREAEAEFRKTL